MFTNLSSIPITTHVTSSTLSLSDSGKYDPEKINPQTFIERIRKVLETLKQGISNGNVNLKKITCPILADTPRNPVVTNCGHIYEEAKLAQWRTEKEITPCTICREPITTAFPVHDLRALIEDWQKEEPILTLSQFKANNPKRAANYLKIAKSCSDEEEALGLYAMAFWFTNRSEDYAAVPEFYQQLNQPAKAALSYLHLALYQLQEDKVEEAIQTLEYCKQISPELLKIDGIIIGLHLMGTQPITSALIANNLWDRIENWHKIESFPTLSHFKEDNKRRADLHLDIAKEYNISDEKETLDAYRKAFFYTNRSEDYAAVPEFYKQLEQPKKAALAYLHLALYQLREDKVQEAIISLGYCKQINPELLKIDEFINLCLALNFRQEQMNKALSIASTQADPEEAIYIYKQIIAHNPCLFEAYTALLLLLKDPEERKHLPIKSRLSCR